METFSPSRLELARRRRGFTFNGLAEAVGVSRNALGAFVAGRLNPAEDTVRRLALALEFPVGFFYAGEVDLLQAAGATGARRYQSETASFRALRSMSARDRERALATGALGIVVGRWFDDHIEWPRPFVPELDGESPERAAALLRDTWEAGDAPIANMVAMLEHFGVKVFFLAPECREIDAFAFWSGGVPYIFLNPDKSGERLRFDCAHELGHLVLHRHGDWCGRQAEEEANAFASAFLMPEQFDRELPSYLTLDALQEMKPRWGVSVAAMVRRCFERELLTEWEYRSAYIELTRTGQRTRERGELPAEYSRLLPTALGRVRSLGLTPARLAADLFLPWQEFTALIPNWNSVPVRRGHLQLLPSAAEAH